MTHEDIVHLQVIGLVMSGVQLPPMFSPSPEGGPAGFIYMLMLTRVMDDLAAVVAHSHHHGGQY